MKIKKIIATEVLVPTREGAINSPGLNRPLHKLPSGGMAGWSVQFDKLPKVILRVEFDNGIVGLGECYRDHNWKTIEQISASLLARSLNDFCLQQLPIPWCREHDGFECALWDAYARAHQMPLVNLLGGAVRTQIHVSAWSGQRHLEEIGTLARGFAQSGYDCIKFKCDLHDDVAGWCRAIADAAPGMRVILDPNERWLRSAEVRSRMDALNEIGNVFCFEDPIPQWMLPEYANLRRYGSIPIVYHLAIPYMFPSPRLSEALEAIRENAVDGFNFNAGFTHFQRLEHIAGAAGLPCWHGSEIDLGISEAMYLHQCAAAESCIWPNDIFGRLIRLHDLLKKPLDLKPPFMFLPVGPGLGVELDEEALKHYCLTERIFEV